MENSISRFLSNFTDINKENRVQFVLDSRKSLDVSSNVIDKLGGGISRTSSRPWDFEDYLERLKSFKIDFWFAPPFQINPTIIARFGWKISEPETLLCEVCKNQIILDGKLEPKLLLKKIK